jgi:hypothetical protein
MTYVLRFAVLVVAGVLFTRGVAAILQVMADREAIIADAFDDPASGPATGFLIGR